MNSGHSSRVQTFKSTSSHTSSLKTIYKEKLQDVGFIQEQDKEDLHSSSSADTIPIKDKIVVPDAHKLKEYVDSRTHKRAQDNNKNKVSIEPLEFLSNRLQVKFSNQVPVISKSTVYRLRQSSKTSLV